MERGVILVSTGTMSIKYDFNAEKYKLLYSMSKLSHPDYYQDLIRQFKSLAYSMGDEEGIRILNDKIYRTIEKPIGRPINVILMTYKNMPALNSMSRVYNEEAPKPYIYKYELKGLLDAIEDYIFERAQRYEGSIRFRDTDKII